MAEATETRETLERVERATEAAASQHRFARRAAVVVSLLAAGLAVSSLGASASVTEAILAQQTASDKWNEFQANSLKRHINEGDATLIRLTAPNSAEGKKKADDLERAVQEKYRPNQDRLMSEARHLEEERDAAETRHRRLQVAEGAFQLAIVLGSVSIIAGARMLLFAAIALGAVGALVTLNAFLRIVPLG